MTEPQQTSPDRLDSWKAIAEYLQREVRTVRRWEQKLGLPVRRVPGPRGHSVFAYVSEIDEWLKKTPPAGFGPNPPEGDPAPDGDRLPDVVAAPTARWRVRIGLIAAAAALAIVAAIGWRARTSVDAAQLSFTVTAQGIVARSPAGVEQWTYAFPTTEKPLPNNERTGPPQIVLGNGDGILIGVSNRIRTTDDVPLAGQLLWLDGTGELRKSFSFADSLEFGAGTYGGPWSISDYRVHDERGVRRIAVSGHHYHWWPSFVTRLDDRWRATGTFVNAGWIEALAWISGDRLLAAGFSNARDGAMVALLDANALDGQSPAVPNADFRCVSCVDAGPLRYVVMPRTEVNIATGSRFNRAKLEASGDRVVIRTIEMPSENEGPADALYEFSPSLDLVTASFSDRYWDVHRSLEMQGRIRHAREACPDRNGPRSIEMWEPSTGWRTVKIQPIAR